MPLDYKDGTYQNVDSTYSDVVSLFADFQFGSNYTQLDSVSVFYPSITIDSSILFGENYIASVPGLFSPSLLLDSTLSFAENYVAQDVAGAFSRGVTLYAYALPPGQDGTITEIVPDPLPDEPDQTRVFYSGFEIVSTLHDPDFDGTPLSGEAPLAVQFDATPVPELFAKTFLWDFGDGTLSYERDPLHTYLSEGVYDVSLTVSYDENDLTKTKTSYISVSVTELVGDMTAIDGTYLFSGDGTFLPETVDGDMTAVDSTYLFTGDGTFFTGNDGVMEAVDNPYIWQTTTLPLQFGRGFVSKFLLVSDTIEGEQRDYKVRTRKKPLVVFNEEVGWDQP